METTTGDVTITNEVEAEEYSTIPPNCKRSTTDTFKSSYTRTTAAPGATRDPGAVRGPTNGSDLTADPGGPGVNPAEAGAPVADPGLRAGGRTRGEVPALWHVPGDLAHVTERSPGASPCTAGLDRGAAAAVRSTALSSCRPTL